MLKFHEPDVPDPRILAAAESFPLLEVGGDIGCSVERATEDWDGRSAMVRNSTSSFINFESC